MTMCGVVTSAQVAVALLETTAEVQASLPLAVTVLVIEHASIDAVKVAVKLADAPGAKVATVNPVLATATLFRVTLPVLLTVPL